MLPNSELNGYDEEKSESENGRIFRKKVRILKYRIIFGMLAGGLWLLFFVWTLAINHIRELAEININNKIDHLLAKANDSVHL